MHDKRADNLNKYKKYRKVQSTNKYKKYRKKERHDKKVCSVIKNKIYQMKEYMIKV